MSKKAYRVWVKDELAPKGHYVVVWADAYDLIGGDLIFYRESGGPVYSQGTWREPVEQVMGVVEPKRGVADLPAYGTPEVQFLREKLSELTHRLVHNRLSIQEVYLLKALESWALHGVPPHELELVEQRLEDGESTRWYLRLIRS